MLLDIESIPDLRAGQTPAPDIDSIKCPDFGPPQLTREYPPPALYALNGYSGSAAHDSFTEGDDGPYHAREDSKPFSYGTVMASPVAARRRSTSEGAETSPSGHRRGAHEPSGETRAGLGSPRLVRRVSAGIGGQHETPRRSPSPDAGTLRRERSQTLTTKIMIGGDVSPPSSLGRSTLTKSASRLDEDEHAHDSLSRSLSAGGNLSWLQMQQKKLAERKEARMHAERGPHQAKMFCELRTRVTQHRKASGRELEDGYISDTTLLSETSRESSPLKAMSPLTINTSAAAHQKASLDSGPLSAVAGGTSLSYSSALGSKGYGKERSGLQPSYRSLPRKQEVLSDKERPFVAVKRAHDNSKGDTVDSGSALNQLQSSPHGQINYQYYSGGNQTTSGLLTTISSAQADASLEVLTNTSSSMPDQPNSTSSPVLKSQGDNGLPASSSSPTESKGLPTYAPNCKHSREDSSWHSDSDASYGVQRPLTPGFPPATPTTPYLNQGLPPKSPTLQRRETGIRSPSPGFPPGTRQELNGHSSPAPSVYHGQSRRSSLTSLNEATEVISSHPKFVKDVSKYWYKPSIARDEAISMLKDKPPGTFVVRDSNSFPRAFGLALKVATPPPNIASSKSSDPASELVRHFLIEPTSRGVRLKGCVNEPVFGSLSALVYQHSITALALPCKLILPDRDPSGTKDASTSNSSNANQLLQQGAACNVLYLYTADTESLTGPQAVKRAVQMTLKTGLSPAVVHFKVSSQGITLTDNTRKLFFRRHYPVSAISHCGLDPDERRWTQKNEDGTPAGSLRIFGFVAKKGTSRTENQCHILAELEPEQPATAICNFVTKVMMTSSSRLNLV